MNTPGPWHLTLDARNGNPSGIDRILNQNPFNRLLPEWKANARLIAAAPQLLALIVDPPLWHDPECGLYDARKNCTCDEGQWLTQRDELIAEIEGRS